MNFSIRENLPNGTLVGVIPTGSSATLLLGDRNNNGSPAFAIGADNVIRVNDSSELDFERLATSSPIYQILVTKDGPDEIINITVEDDPDERFLGSSGNDLLRSSNWGGSTLLGLAGNDQLIGSFPRETIIGGEGTDTLTGGQSADSFVFDAPLQSGVDTITDFASGFRGETDRLVLDKDAFPALKTRSFSFQAVQNLKAARRSRA